MLDRAIRAAVGVHDLGKLSTEWQGWAREYQQRIGRPVCDPGYAIVHTDCFTDAHRSVELQLRRRRPPHAVEGAVCAARTLKQAVACHDQLFRATLMAVARHHSADASDFRKVKLEAAAGQALEEALGKVGFERQCAKTLATCLLYVTPCTDIVHHFLKAPGEEQWEAWFAYFVIVRCLRLADAGALEDNEENDYDQAATG
jgi:hypothetical protein